MDLKNIVREHLSKAFVMQLATVKDGQPWLCTVHFAPGDDFTMYWVSHVSRRHSQDLAENPKAAVAVVVKAPEHPVIGIQMEGKAGPAEDESEIKRAMEIYAGRHASKKEFMDAVLGKQTPLRLYKFIPEYGVMFDEANFPENPRQEWLLKAKA